MSEAVVASLKGYYFETEAGRRYAWCSCGRSATQPFCDGAHEGTGFRPLVFAAARAEEVVFCGCKRTRTPPFCDGSHNNIDGGYSEDDPDSPDNRAIGWAKTGGPITRLDERCYIFHTQSADLAWHGSLGLAQVAGPALGARHQSQFYVAVRPGTSPVVSADGRDVILFVADGEVIVEVGANRIVAAQRSGVYVRPDEAFRIVNETDRTAKLFISNAPGTDTLIFLDTMPPVGAFNPAERIESVEPNRRHAMGDRHHQLLVNRRHGSEVVTQFIGNIPLSKGMPHRHLYEEALIFLSGEGVVWNETLRAPVAPGDVLFLPGKHLHAVQCVSGPGMDVVGVILPGDNPAVNY